MSFPRVVKMSGAGNDFVVLDPEQRARIEGSIESWTRRVCRRGLSVGADGVLLVSPAGADRVRVRFLNPDGSAAFCGNGSRCAARFAHRRGFAGPAMVLDTAIGDVPATVERDRVRLELPAPRDLGPVTLELSGESVTARRIEAGVPHVVLRVPSVGEAPLAEWGPRVRRDPRFGAAGTNVDLISDGPGGRLLLRTWERGVEGETLACGSGAVAAAYAAREAGGEEWVRVLPASGIPLEVAFPGPPDAPRAALLAGDARFVFEATLGEEALTGEG